MDRMGEWRTIEPAPAAEPGGAGSQAATVAAQESGRARILIAASLAAAVLGIAGLALWVSTPQPQLVLLPAGQLDAADPSGTAEAMAAASAAEQEMVVDVQGAVMIPGVHRLSAGSRVGDAIVAAGGYSPQVDIRAAAERLNLAQRLEDGTKVQVPARGESTPAPQSGGDVPGSTPSAPVDGGSGLVDVNSADQARLETLPGIGPVTAGKIIAAREEAPFATIDDLLGRNVVGPATFEKIRPLITVAP